METTYDDVFGLQFERLGFQAFVTESLAIIRREKGSHPRSFLSSAPSLVTRPDPGGIHLARVRRHLDEENRGLGRAYSAPTHPEHDARSLQSLLPFTDHICQGFSLVLSGGLKGSRELERRLELAGEGFEVMDDVLWDVGPLFRPLMIVFKLHQIQGSIPHPLIFLSQVSGHPLPTGTPSRTALMILRSY